MTNLSSVVKTKRVRNAVYNKPVVGIDEDTGEIVADFDSSGLPPVEMGDMHFLYRFIGEELELDDGTAEFHCTKIESIDIANAYLIEKALTSDSSSSQSSSLRQSSQALREYFQYLYDNNLSWHDFSPINREKPTYRFRRFLKRLANIGVEKEEDRIDEPLAVSTVKAYMRCVVNFYKILIEKGFKFNEAPYEYEEVTIYAENQSPNSMQKYRKIVIPSSNLRIKAKSQKSTIPNYLRAMSEYEFEQFDRQFRLRGWGVRKQVDGKLTRVNISTEIKLQLLLCRYAGLRTEESASIRLFQIFKPNEHQLKTGYVDIHLSPENFNDVKFDKARKVEVPANLMLSMYEYTKKSEYRAKKKKYTEKHPDANPKKIPAFINDDGNKVASNSLTTRFSEIRRAINLEQGINFTHKNHNLRSTYAVTRLRDRAKIHVAHGSQPYEAWEKALDHVKNRLGHESIATTQIYLLQAQDTTLEIDETVESILEFADNITPSKFQVFNED
ncbi:site-specific integrase [Vibrio vulnificus]|uniref:site-specific integrase n=1 Tax=Vibrio vulnificus TaxID=672 RepID=UPI00102CD43D|nr:site-specific integrase [Vibrio vulnificus]MCA4022864.1 site-specific integrase [Vibrio vulnificus]RZR43756.1 site-specific integrase [Vibrio vulnificus]